MGNLSANFGWCRLRKTMQKIEPSGYRKEGNEFAFYGGRGQFEFRCESVAVVGQRDLGDGEGAFLRKHGPSETVNAWFKKERAQLIEKGGQEWAKDLFLIESDKWNLVELNRCIQITGYVGILLQRIYEPGPESKNPVDELLEGFDE